MCRRKLGADGIANVLGQRRVALVLVEVALELTDELVGRVMPCLA